MILLLLHAKFWMGNAQQIALGLPQHYAIRMQEKLYFSRSKGKHGIEVTFSKEKYLIFFSQTVLKSKISEHKRAFTVKNIPLTFTLHSHSNLALLCRRDRKRSFVIHLVLPDSFKFLTLSHTLALSNVDL